MTITPPKTPRALLALGALLTLAGCGVVETPGPFLRSSPVTADMMAQRVRVDALVDNRTDSLLWVREIDFQILSDGIELTSGTWSGEHEIRPSSSVTIHLEGPVFAGAPLVTGARATFLADVHYSRPGVAGVLGGQSRDFELPTRLLVVGSPAAQPSGESTSGSQDAGGAP